MNNSNGPKSFRDMKFPPSRDGTRNAIYAPLPPAPAPRTISVDESAIRAYQLKEMRNFINSQRCLVCSAQLDGPVSYDGATVYCCEGGEKEYKAKYVFGIEVPTRSICTFYTTHVAFEIDTTHLTDGLYKNILYKIDLSLNPKFQQAEKKELLNYEGERLLFKKNWTEEELLNKVKLYTLFS